MPNEPLKESDLNPEELAIFKNAEERIKTTLAESPEHHYYGTLILNNFGLTTKILGLVLSKYASELAPVKSLFLNSNNLEDGLPPEIENLRNLSLLHANHAKLKTLPPEIGSLHNLQKLRLEENELMCLPATINNLKNITTLELSENKFVEFPDITVELPALERLDLSYNLIVSVPPTIADLKNLSHLNLRHNALTGLPVREIETMQRLVNLDVSANSLPESTLYRLNELHVGFRRDRRVPNPRHLFITMDSIDPDTKWRHVLGLSRLHACRQIDKAVPGTFDISYANQPTQRVPASKVLTEIILRLGNDLDHEIPVVREKLAMLFDEKIPLEEKQNLVAEMAVYAGDCTSPVKDWIMKCRIAKLLTNAPYEELEERDQRMVERECIWQKTAEMPALQRDIPEKIEIVATLINSLYKNTPFCKKNGTLQYIDAGRVAHQLPDKSRYDCVDFVRDDVAKQFIRLVCEEDAAGNPITDKNGHYKLDLSKVNSITKLELERHGYISEKDKRINELVTCYKDRMKKLLENTSILAEYNDKDVIHCTDIEARGKELKALLNASDDMQQRYHDYMADAEHAISALAVKFGDKELQKVLQPSVDSLRKPGPQGAAKNASDQETQLTKGAVPPKMSRR